MSVLTLGFIPVNITVELAYDGYFIQTLVPQDAGGLDSTWDVGAEIELRFLTGPDDVAPVVWPATINVGRTQADFNADVTEVNTVIDSDRKFARLHYIDVDGNDILWGRGKTQVV